MSNQPVRKWRAALNMDEQKNLAKANPKSISKSDKYGTSQWVDVAEWSDGNLTISGYDPESKTRFNIGIGRAQDEQQAQQKTTAKSSAQPVEADDLPF